MDAGAVSAGIKKVFKYPSIALPAAGILVAVMIRMTSLELSILEATATSDRRNKHGSRWFSTMESSLGTLYRSLPPSHSQLPPLTAIQTSSSSSSSSLSYNNHHHHHLDGHNEKEQEDYNWSVSTEDNFRSDNTEFHGTFSPIRDMLDHSYHANYSPGRQLIQDSIIESMLLLTKVKDVDTGIECRVPTEPWIVFTAGVYGKLYFNGGRHGVDLQFWKFLT
jgi:hypothetical protein